MKGGTGKIILMTMAAWFCILGSFAYWFEMDSRKEEKHRALVTANAFFQQVVISLQWNASHSGVYVPIPPTIQPNEYLPIQGRDLTADNGLKLTKINPSNMTRQIAELAKNNESGIQFPHQPQTDQTREQGNGVGGAMAQVFRPGNQRAG